MFAGFYNQTPLSVILQASSLGGSGGAKKEGTPRQSTSESLLAGYLSVCGHSVS